MGPKKDTTTAPTASGENGTGPSAAASGTPTTIDGFDNKETRLLAAAFVASIGVDKYNHDVMATLTGNTAGTLKKFWPKVKATAMEKHPSFGTYLSGNAPSGDATKTGPKANGGKKRKAPEDEVDKEGKSKGRPKKGKAKAEETAAATDAPVKPEMETEV